MRETLFPTIISLLLTLDDPLEEAARRRFGLEERLGEISGPSSLFLWI